MKKLMIGLVGGILFFTCVGISVFQDLKAKSVDIPVVATAYEAKKFVSPYYNALAKEEKEDYQEMKGALDTYDCMVKFENPISVNSISRICDTLRSNEENPYTYWGETILLDKNLKLVSSSIEQEEAELNKKQVQSIIFIYNISKEDETTKDMELVEKDGEYYVPQALYDAITLDSSCETEEAKLKYEGQKKEIDKKIDQVVADMPKGLSQEEVITYFRTWLLEHITYDQEAFENSRSEDLGKRLEAKASTTTATIIRGKGICGGIANVLTALCNRVGVECYTLAGITTYEGQTNYHAWNKMVIDGKAYYIDITKEIGFGELGKLKTYEQFNGGNIQYIPFPHFSEVI